MKDRCFSCGKNLSDGGYSVRGDLGKWKGKRITVCDSQCLISWDTTGDEGSRGNQGVNLDRALFNLRPLKPVIFPQGEHPLKKNRLLP